jgi:APA family basic amino acid/polyamine antiporter
VSRTGGPYSYVAIVLGPYAGFLAGVLLWLLGTTAVASVASACAGFVGALAPALSGPLARAMMLAGAFAVMTAINVAGVKQGSRLITVLAAVKLLPLLVLVGVGALAITPSNLVVSHIPATSSLARAAIVLIFAFTGVESALVPSGEMKNPSRTVPWAIAIAMTGITALYVAIQTVAQGVLGPALADAKSAPLALVGERLMGAPGRDLLLVGAIVSTLGYLSGMTLAVPRALFALARDGFLPGAVASVHPRFLTPHVAIVLQSVVVCALAIGNEFEALAVLANLSALLLYFACAVSGYLLKRRGIQDGGTKPFSLPGGPTVHILACAMIVWLLTSITLDEWTKVGLTLAVATVIFGVTRSGAARRPRASGA